MAEMVTLTVSQALGIAKEKLEGIYIRVIGEVSEFSDKPGYKAAYFSIGDKSSVLPCMMWRAQYDASGVTLRSGMLVELTGKFSLYAAKGRMNFSVSRLEAAGEGNLKAQVAARLEMLRNEGLTDDARKVSVPNMAEKIAVVTSPQGKAIHDVLRTLRRRFPYAEVFFFGVKVEGESAPADISHAIAEADRIGADVMLVVRGGGSYEDLLPFSSEEVARAIVAAKTPIVTGVGHEPDVSIADYVADKAASTPTAAAEAVTPSREEVVRNLNQKRKILSGALQVNLDSGVHALAVLMARNIFSDPLALFMQKAQTVDGLHQRLDRAIPTKIARDKISIANMRSRLSSIGTSFMRMPQTKVGTAASRLNDLSPLKILSRGYAVAFDERSGLIVKNVDSVGIGDSLSVRIADGELGCSVISKTKTKG